MPRQSFASAGSESGPAARTASAMGQISIDPTGTTTGRRIRSVVACIKPAAGTRRRSRTRANLPHSLDAHGQQEPILARLITDTDRQRWPDAFSKDQILVILKGHRVYNAMPKTRLKKLRVELMLPIDGEDDVNFCTACPAAGVREDDAQSGVRHLRQSEPLRDLDGRIRARKTQGRTRSLTTSRSAGKRPSVSRSSRRSTVPSTQRSSMPTVGRQMRLSSKSPTARRRNSAKRSSVSVT